MFEGEAFWKERKLGLGGGGSVPQAAQLRDKHTPGWEAKLPHLFHQHFSSDLPLTFPSLRLSKLAAFRSPGSNPDADAPKAMLILV